MFEKNVKIDGAVYGYHEVTEVKHVKDRATAIRVRSYAKNPRYGISQSMDQVINLPLDDSLTFSAAEEVAEDRPEFEEYVDPEQSLLQELAPTLTDEQASTVMDIYPEWRATASYSVGDRVRYSDGFYKCLQAHDAQTGWNPSSSASLWAPIIDASVLPIGEYPLWQQPDSVNPYMTGDIVTHNSLLWRSIVDNNVWAPGIYGWEVYQEPSPEPGPDEPEAISDWVQPDSTHPYMNGDQVRHDGSIWQSTVDNNVWEPGVYGWDFVEEDPDYEPENPQGENSETESGSTEGGTESGTTEGGSESGTTEGGSESGSTEGGNETEPTVEIQDWVQPDSTNPYMTGDLVMFEGAIYRSTIDGNIWSPSAYPQGWALAE